MLKRWFRIILLTNIMMFTLVGCGSASSSAESDVSLQMRNEMEDELKSDDDLKSEVSDVIDEEIVEATNQEENEINTAEDDTEEAKDAVEDEDDSSSDNIKKGEIFEIVMELTYIDDNPAPVSIDFSFVIDKNKRVLIDNLTKKSYVVAKSYDDKSVIYFSPEHLNEIRNIFIEMYNSYLAEHQDEMYEECNECFLNNGNGAIKEIDGVLESFKINIGGTDIDFENKSTAICISDEFQTTDSNDPQYHGMGYVAEIYFDAETDRLDDLNSYFSSMIEEDAAKGYDFADFSLVDSVIQPSKPESDSNEAKTADNKDSNSEPKEEKKSSSVVGTWWDPTGYNDAELTFNADGTGQNYAPSTGKVSYTFTYTVDGNRVTVPGKYYTSVYIVDGDTLRSDDGNYKRK